MNEDPDYDAMERVYEDLAAEYRAQREALMQQSRDTFNTAATVPAFTSTEDADAWMEKMNG
jgi:hypothetical protein